MKMQNVCENACKGLVTPSLVQGAEVQHETVKKREGGDLLSFFPGRFLRANFILFTLGPNIFRQSQCTLGSFFIKGSLYG